MHVRCLPPPYWRRFPRRLWPSIARLDVKVIDDALPKSNLAAAQNTEVMKLRDEEEARHKARGHKESVCTLGKAMRIILNNM